MNTKKLSVTKHKNMRSLTPALCIKKYPAGRCGLKVFACCTTAQPTPHVKLDGSKGG
jgi:hypothetical protein